MEDHSPQHTDPAQQPQLFEAETLPMHREAPAEAPGPRRRLGRGLGALLGGGSSGGSEPAAAPSPAEPAPDDTALLREVPIDQIERNPFQPRVIFPEESLNELAESVKQHGVLQPILVRPHGGHFQLIAGERRWLSAKRAGLTTIPCRVMLLEDRDVCEAALEENIKRQDLNALEKAHAFKAYLERFGSTIEELAGRLSLNRSTVSNFIRLLDLPEPVQKALRADRISAGHARALLALATDEERIALCKRIEKESLSVRQVEREVKGKGEGEAGDTIPFPASGKQESSAVERTAHVQSLEEQLRDLLGAKVKIQLTGKDAGRIIIQFDTNDDFMRIVRQIRKAA